MKSAKYFYGLVFFPGNINAQRKSGIRQQVLPLTTAPLNANALHIWRIPLPSGEAPQPLDGHLLSAHEKMRVEKVHGDIAKQQFIAVHLALRHILASYLNISVERLELSATNLKKPILAPAHYAIDIRFNLSHSGNLAVAAVARATDVGIDVEQLSIERKVPGILRRYFSDPTIRAIMALPEPQRKLAFLRVWTQYEAYKKAQGLGLRGGDPKLFVALNEFPLSQFLPLFSGPIASQWQVAGLQLPTGWVGAVVIQHQEEAIDLHYFDYRRDGR